MRLYRMVLCTYCVAGNPFSGTLIGKALVKDSPHINSVACCSYIHARTLTTCLCGILS